LQCTHVDHTNRSCNVFVLTLPTGLAIYLCEHCQQIWQICLCGNILVLTLPIGLTLYLC
jgi:hypothetical protein